MQKQTEMQEQLRSIFAQVIVLVCDHAAQTTPYIMIWTAYIELWNSWSLCALQN